MRSLSTVDAGVAGRWRLAQKPHVNANDNTNRSTSRVWGGIAPLPCRDYLRYCGLTRYRTVGTYGTVRVCLSVT